MKRLWGENLEKVARRERHLRDVADASGMIINISGLTRVFLYVGVSSVFEFREGAVVM